MIATRRYWAWTTRITIGAALSVGAGTSANAANLFANVGPHGAFISGSGVASMTVFGAGQYEITFTSDVSGCAYVATTMNAYSQAVQVFPAGGHLSSSGVYVQTKNQGGGLLDAPFSLVVDCGTPGMSFAVVGYSADLVRATPGTTLTPLGAGRYNVTFPASVKACSYIATVGDPGSEVVFSPSTVYTGSGASSKMVYVETKDPSGGLQSGVPFHLAVICAKAKKASIVVVDSAGLPNRGSALTSSYRGSDGEYDLVTNAKINPACATVATRGSVDKAVPSDPATVEIVQGPAANTIGIEVRSLLAFDGALINGAFHAATICP